MSGSEPPVQCPSCGAWSGEWCDASCPTCDQGQAGFAAADRGEPFPPCILGHPRGDGRSAPPCPMCSHTDDEHRRESWYDEEGIEGMTCETCENAGKRCQWWTWDWPEVVAQTALHEGDDDQETERS